MHEFQHVITGHSAVASIKQALGIDDGDIVNQADDLSIGPLGDADALQSPFRSAFLRQVWGEDSYDRETGFRRSFESELAAVAKDFRDLPSDRRPCLVWFGSNANEQLTLRRAARFLEGSPRQLWGIEILPQDQRPLPPHWCPAVAVLNPKELTAIFQRRRLISDNDRARLAAEWHSLCAESSDATMRHFADGRVETRSIESYDERIRAAAPAEWGNAARLVGNIMGNTEDAYVSDIFIFWRVHVLARKGILEIDPADAPMRESRVRQVG
jgi:hypothetical protein